MQHHSSTPFCCDLLSSRERNADEASPPPFPLLIPIRAVHLGLPLGNFSEENKKIPLSSVFCSYWKGKESFDKGRYPDKHLVCRSLVLFAKVSAIKR